MIDRTAKAGNPIIRDGEQNINKGNSQNKDTIDSTKQLIAATGKVTIASSNLSSSAIATPSMSMSPMPSIKTMLADQNDDPTEETHNSRPSSASFESSGTATPMNLKLKNALAVSKAGRSSLIRGLGPSTIKGAWTLQEDEQLTQLVQKHGPRRWTFIASQMSGRLGKQCRER